MPPGVVHRRPVVGEATGLCEEKAPVASRSDRAEVEKG